MSEIRNFQVNKDGSITMSEPSIDSESTIIDILKIERAKGGIFSSLRMKRRAIKYAKANGLPNPDLVVERLILEHYPACFKNISLAQWVIWLSLALTFLLCGMFLWFIAKPAEAPSQSLISIICVVVTVLLIRRINGQIAKNKQLEVQQNKTKTNPDTKMMEEKYMRDNDVE